MGMISTKTLPLLKQAPQLRLNLAFPYKVLSKIFKNNKNKFIKKQINNEELKLPWFHGDGGW